jgi:hypothetical protein
MKKRERIFIAMGAAAVMVFGATSQAAAQAAPVMPQFCWFAPKQPVCGERAKMKFTYANAGCAVNDGAKIVAQGACAKATAKAKKGGKKSAKKAKKGGKKAALKGKKGGKKSAAKAKKGGKKAAKKSGKKPTKKS